MIQQEESYLVYKKNAGEIQESVKFPVRHRDSLNALLIGILGTPFDAREFDRVHSNTLINNCVDKETVKKRLTFHNTNQVLSANSFNPLTKFN
jgi:hypothetical protein